MSMEKLMAGIEAMKNSTVGNYIIPGLSSSMVGGGEFGKVRLFEASRNQLDAICPHSHRFDFVCLVLVGSVANNVWTETDEDFGDLFQLSRIVYSGDFTGTDKTAIENSFWESIPEYYNAGETYSMKASDIHSIEFSKDAKVLFFEGPSISDSSVILEPVVDGKTIPTYQKPDWMFTNVSQN